MLFIEDKRRQNNHEREEYGSVRNLFLIFFKSLFKKYLPLKFQFMTLNTFKQL